MNFLEKMAEIETYQYDDNEPSVGDLNSLRRRLNALRQQTLPPSSDEAEAENNIDALSRELQFLLEAVEHDITRLHKGEGNIENLEIAFSNLLNALRYIAPDVRTPAELAVNQNRAVIERLQEIIASQPLDIQKRIRPLFDNFRDQLYAEE